MGKITWASADFGGHMDVKQELEDQKYAKAYSADSLIEKITKFAKAAGIKVVYVALLCFYTLQSAETPAWAKSVIIGALGYFIFPVDLIPDFIPVAGFADDFTALVAAIAAVAMYVDDAVHQQAKDRLHVWFGSFDDDELNIAEIKK